MQPHNDMVWDVVTEEYGFVMLSLRNVLDVSGLDLHPVGDLGVTGLHLLSGCTISLLLTRTHC